MGNSLTHANSTTVRQVRKVLRRAKLYRGLQKRVARRRGVSEVTVSKAFKQPTRYADTVLAILEELARREPGMTNLVELWRAGLGRAA